MKNQENEVKIVSYSKIQIDEEKQVEKDEVEKGDKDNLDKDEVDKGQKDSLENVSLLEQGDIEKVKKKKRKSNDLKDNPNAYSTKKTAVCCWNDGHDNFNSKWESAQPKNVGKPDRTDQL